MSDSTFSLKPTARSLTTQWDWKRYILLGALLNAAIWGVTLLYLKLTPSVYNSQWAISVNGGKLSTNVNLPGIGQATSSSESSYNAQSSDPRENYKFLVTTSEVLESAAKQMNLPVGKFGKPQAKILNNTTLMQIEIQAETPELAQKKAFALQQALESRLDELRLEEISRQQRNLQPTLEPLKERLKVALQKLYTYKAQSPLSSVEQLKSASENLEGLRRSYAEAVAQLAQMQTRAQQLSSSLNSSPAEAASALVLQSNQLFQQYLADYSKASAELARLSSRYTPKSPAWIAKQKAKDEAYAGLVQQSQVLLGRAMPKLTLEQLSLGSSSAQRSALFQEILLLQEQYQGQRANVVALSQQINQLESRISLLAQEEGKLDSLEREVKIADAVYSSNLTKLDLSNSINSPSYPPIAVMTKPSLTDKPVAPKKTLVFLGSSLGTVLITIGITALWFRNCKQQVRQLDNYQKPDGLV